MTGDPSQADLLATLLHDRDEDLTEEIIGTKQFGSMQVEMHQLQSLLTPDERWFLGERLALLTHRPEHTYNEYLARLMEQSQQMPDLLRAKLADRLDNTLDVGVNLHGLPDHGAYGNVFDLMFLPGYPGLKAPESYVPLSAAEIRQILANLFKNAEFVNLLRTEGCFMAGTTKFLAHDIVVASTRIARFLLQDALVTLQVAEQRGVVDAVHHYCAGGGLTGVYQEGRHRFDGLFLGNKQQRKDRIGVMVTDRQTRAEIALLFLTVFSAFRTDPGYQIQGIDRSGVRAVPRPGTGAVPRPGTGE